MASLKFDEYVVLRAAQKGRRTGEEGTWNKVAGPQSIGSRGRDGRLKWKELWLKRVKDMIWVCIPALLLNN